MQTLKQFKLNAKKDKQIKFCRLDSPKVSAIAESGEKCKLSTVALIINTWRHIAWKSVTVSV